MVETLRRKDGRREGIEHNGIVKIDEVKRTFLHALFGSEIDFSAFVRLYVLRVHDHCVGV